MFECADGSTALHQACSKANDDAVELLLHYGADVNIADMYGRTALHWACTVSSTHCLQVHTHTQTRCFMVCYGASLGVHCQLYTLPAGPHTHTDTQTRCFMVCYGASLGVHCQRYTLPAVPHTHTHTLLHGLLRRFTGRALSALHTACRSTHTHTHVILRIGALF